MKPTPKYASKNLKVVNYEELTIHAMTPCVKYAAMVFEGIRAYWNEELKQSFLFRLNCHNERFFDSAKILNFEHNFTFDELNNSLIELLRTLDTKTDTHIRQMMYVDGNGELDSSKPVHTVAVALSRKSNKEQKGLKILVSSWRRIDDVSMPPRIKSAANYQNGRLAKLQARHDGYDNALLLNANGKVAEGPGACFFIVKDGVLITPPKTSAILESITRDTIITIAKSDLNLAVEERDIDRTEIYLADEAFFCGSGAELTHIYQLDQHKIGDGTVGKITDLIHKYYLKIVTGQVEKYKHWLTPVY